MSKILSRRDFIKAGALTLLGAGGAAALGQKAQDAGAAPPHPGHSPDQTPMSHPTGGDAMPMMVGEVDHKRNGFNPSDILTDFDYGKVSTLANGQTLREYDIYVINKDIEIAPGIVYPAWTYNGRIPGPTLRCTEGDHLRITLRNGSSHPHSLHFHGVHSAEMDGVPGTPGVVLPGESFTYEFDAEPFGLHLYHCHVAPLARHIAKGLYGAFIIDPKGGRPAVDHEFVMVMSGFDIDFDNANDFYAVNAHPLPLPAPPDPDQGRGESARLPGQHPGIRPDQLLPPACQFFQLLSHRHQPDPQRIHRQHHADPGAARHPGVLLPAIPACICSMPTIPSLPSWAGPATSKLSP